MQMTWDSGKKTLAAARNAALLGAAIGLAACGGGGNDAASTNPAVLPPAITPKSCNNVAGTLDTVQTAISSTLKPAVQALPTIGTAASGATTALSQTLDTVDAISNALTTLARTQNAAQFSTQLSGAGDSVLCASSSLSDALSQLAASQGAPIPGLSVVQNTLSLVAARVADGLVGTTPGADLSSLTAQLVTLASQLRTLSGNLPVGANQPYLKEVLALNAASFDSLALILGDLGALNGNKLATDVNALLTTLASSFKPTATQLGVPSSVLSTLSTQFQTALGVTTGTLGAVAAPNLQAVSSVLAAAQTTAVGTAAGSFSDLLDGALAGTTAGAASTTRVTQLTAQLASGSLLTALLQSFGGKLPI